MSDSLFTPSREEFRRLAREANLIPVYRRFNADLETPVSAYLKIKRGPYSYLLESVEGGERIARYSMIGTEPSEIITSQADEKDKNPLETLDDRLAEVRYARLPGLPTFSGGAVGYLAYETVRHFEPSVLPASFEHSGMGLPEAVFMLTDTLVVFDHVKHEILAIAHASVGDTNLDLAYDEACKKVLDTARRLEDPLPPQRRIAVPSYEKKSPPLIVSEQAEMIRAGMGPPESPRGAYFANMTQEAFHDMVEECKRNIREGEVIQVVVSQRLLRRTDAEPFDLYRALRGVNPSPYMFFLDMDGFQIVGASPELLVSLQDDEVTVRPIAGTQPRGVTPLEDYERELALMSSEKELAEHLMLLDLGRNDVGRVAVPGSVEVPRRMGVERYSHVMHIVSHVRGKLARGKSAFDALRAAFPAGTVSGAPKVRAMQLISEIEPNKRGIYSGAVGYCSYFGNMDFCIALRTMIIKDGVASLQAGGGIVADSVPQDEYEESLHKMGALIRAIETAEAEG